jgi:hypothetical protein
MNKMAAFFPIFLVHIVGLRGITLFPFYQTIRWWTQGTTIATASPATTTTTMLTWSNYSADASHAADPQQHAAQPAASTPTSTPHQSRLAEFLRTRPTTFSQAKDPMDAEDWLKGVEKKLVITQHTDREKVLFATHQLFGTAANYWETYCNTHANVDTIIWNEFKACFRTHYVPRGTMKLKSKEFADLKQDGMTVNEFLNSFIQLSRYAPDDINTDEKKQDVFMSGLNDDIQFQLLNTDYADFQHMVDQAIVIENKIREMEKDGKRKVPFSGQSSGSNVRPRFTQPNQFYKPF